MKNKKYPPLPTIEAIEGILFLGEIINKGFKYAKTFKFTDEEYIEIIKLAVNGDSKW